MNDLQPFGLIVLIVAASGLLAVVSNRLSERVRIPTPAFFLAGAAIVAALAPSLAHVPHQSVERVVTVALIIILFDGGMHIGWRRIRAVAGQVAVVGVLGTFLTTGAVAIIAHLAFGFSWWVSLLLGTAIAPTDPAVVFSVLGKREISGDSGTVLEGESGANDPVGIALMAGLLGAGGLSASAMVDAGGQFLLQMAVGAAVGIAGGRALGWVMRRVALPSEALYPLQTLAGAGVIFGAATVAHGSGFLAVFVAGIALGDGRAPYKREIERFHKALSSLGEIVAFALLGLTINLEDLSSTRVWVPGLVLGLALALIIRPALIGVCLLPFGLLRNERIFVLWAGLKGAVPILLGSFLLTDEAVPQRERLYGIVIVVVAFSVVIQGGSVPAVARLLHIPMTITEPEPWALGVRLRDEPEGDHQLVVADGSAADGSTVSWVTDLADGLWVSLVVRDARVLRIDSTVRLVAGDRVLVVGPRDVPVALVRAFAPNEEGPTDR